jgi:hypothetical protein
MSAHLELTRQILTAVLSSGPQLGARLKQELVREFERRSGERFSVIERQFPTLTSLLTANADLVDVTRPSGPGDIMVRLKPQRSAWAIDYPTQQAVRPLWIPAELWQAFTNPDRRRRRFYNRTTGHVVHFVDGSDAELDRRLAAEVSADNNFIGIDYIADFTQSAWMREFLDSVPLPDGIKKTCSHLASAPYVSAVNTAFTVALAEYAVSWKRFRASRVLDSVQEWAERSGVDLRPVTTASEELPATATEGVTAGTEIGESDARKTLHTLIDSLADKDLEHILIPITLASRVMKARS